MYGSKNLLRLNIDLKWQHSGLSKIKYLNYPLKFMFFKTYTTWSFKVVVFQRMVKKCTKIYNGCFSWHHCCSLPSKLPVYTVYITVKNGFYIRGDQKIEEIRVLQSGNSCWWNSLLQSFRQFQLWRNYCGLLLDHKNSPTCSTCS